MFFPILSFILYFHQIALGRRDLALSAHTKRLTSPQVLILKLLNQICSSLSFRKVGRCCHGLRAALMRDLIWLFLKIKYGGQRKVEAAAKHESWASKLSFLLTSYSGQSIEYDKNVSHLHKGEMICVPIYPVPSPSCVSRFSGKASVTLRVNETWSQH